jgi:hypothetical protein
MPIIYDNSFNKNECVIIIFLIIGLVLILKLKKIFTLKESLVYLLFGFFSGILFDHILSTSPIDLYDVNDQSYYELIDFITYLMYSPYSYLFIYIYKYFNVRLSRTPIYILSYSLISIMCELFFTSMGVFHYKNGYEIYDSFSVYLLTFSFEIMLHRIINNKKTLQAT